MKFFHESHGCSLAVDIVARELGIPLEIVWVDMQHKRLPDGTDLHAINPKGQVPALQLADGQFLSEGLAIIQFLVDQCPDSDLASTARGAEKYRVLEWMSFIGSDLHKGGFMPLFKKTTPPDYRPIALQHIAGRLQWLDRHLADRDYLVGDRFTIADAHCYDRHLDEAPCDRRHALAPARSLHGAPCRPPVGARRRRRPARPGSAGGPCPCSLIRPLPFRLRHRETP